MRHHVIDALGSSSSRLVSRTIVRGSCPDQPGDPRRDGVQGAFAAHDQHRLSQGGGLFLHSHPSRSGMSVARFIAETNGP